LYMPWAVLSYKVYLNSWHRARNKRTRSSAPRGPHDGGNPCVPRLSAPCAVGQVLFCRESCRSGAVLSPVSWSFTISHLLSRLERNSGGLVEG
jgi:hypothetical protein